MKLTKNTILSLFTVTITLITICLNWSKFFMGNMVTVFNLVVSIVFLLLWFIFSFYRGMKQDKPYLKFILIYWCINIIYSVANLTSSLSLNNDRFLLLAPFALWYGCPLYGVSYMFTSNITTKLIIVTAPLGLIVCALGYWVGLTVLKRNKKKNLTT